MRCLMKFNFALFAALFVPVVEAQVVESGWFSEESPAHGFCPTKGNSQSILTGLFCSGKYCDNVKLQCTYKEGYTKGVESWTPFFSEERGPQACPSRSVITGMRCRGSYCDDISLRCVRMTDSVFSGRSKHCDETDWVSEEHGGHKVIPSHSFPIGVRCGGSYCDNKKIMYCYERGYGPNTEWFSEENNGQGICPKVDGSQTMLMGLSCSGAYCDNLKAHCASRGTERVIKTYWTNWFSEETVLGQWGERSCGEDAILTGVRCRGAYCDELSLHCSQLASDFKKYSCGHTKWFSEENEGYAEIPEGAFPTGIRCRGDYCDDKFIHYCFSKPQNIWNPF